MKLNEEGKGMDGSGYWDVVIHHVKPRAQSLGMVSACVDESWASSRDHCGAGAGFGGNLGCGRLVLG